MKPLPHKKLKNSEIVVEKLIEQIRKGSLKAGDKLPNEQDLSEAMGVSRMPLREAINALSQIGILNTRQGHGTFIRPFNSDFLGKSLYWFSLLDNEALIEVFELRKVLEVEAAKLASKNATLDEIEKIRDAMILRESFRDVSGTDPARLEKRFDSSRLFHEAVAEASHNTIVINFVKAIQSSLKFQQQTVFSYSHKTDSADRDQSRITDTTPYYRIIYDDIAAGNSDKAEKHMIEFMDFIRIRLLKVVNQ